MKQLIFDLMLCNGCLTCVLACAAAHSQSGTITGAMAEGALSRIQVLPARGRAVPVACSHCEDPPCVDACMTGAMRKDPRTGIVTNEGGEQACAGCWMCVMVCPYGAITQAAAGKVAIKCDRCAERESTACVDACPNLAIQLMAVDSFAEERARRVAAAVMATCT